MIYRGTGFLAVVSFGTSPFPLPSVSSTGDSKTEKERQLADGKGRKGMGEEPNSTTVSKPGLL
jgi:hypothetical protein